MTLHDLLSNAADIAEVYAVLVLHGRDIEFDHMGFDENRICWKERTPSDQRLFMNFRMERGKRTLNGLSDLARGGYMTIDTTEIEL